MTGNSVLAIDMVDGVAYIIDAGTGANQLNANAFGTFLGHLIVGGTITPLNVPTVEATGLDVSALSIDVKSVLTTGGDLTLLAGQIALNADISAGGPGGGTINLAAVGDATPALAAATGDISAPALMKVSAGGGFVIAQNLLTDPGNMILDFGGGVIEVATDSSDPLTFAAGSAFVSPQTPTPEFAAYATSYTTGGAFGFTNFSADFGFNQASTDTPAADLIGLEELGFIDTGLFEQDLTLFGVIGQGIALALAQCEEIEGCAPNISEDELNEFIVQIEARLEELLRRSAEAKSDAEREKLEELVAGYQEELENFISYREQLQEYLAVDEEDEEFDEDFDEEDFGGAPDVAAIQKLGKMLETVNARIQWLESLKGNPEERARLSESTGIDLTQEALDAIIEGARSEAAFIEKQIKLLQEGTEANIESTPQFIAEAGDHSLAQVISYGPSLLNLGEENISRVGY